MDVTKPCKFMGFGAMDVTKPYKYIGFGAMDVTKPYKFIGFGAKDVTKPYKFIGLRGFSLPLPRAIDVKRSKPFFRVCGEGRETSRILRQDAKGTFGTSVKPGLPPFVQVSDWRFSGP